jgi:site-specific DNA-cytosine methylase
MKVLELFSGSGSIRKVAEKRGHEVFSIDFLPFKGVDLFGLRDMEDVKPSDIPWEPDFIWASPMCQSYSLAAISHHRNKDRSPKTPFAAKSDRVVMNTLSLINAFPDAHYYIENPNATLQKMPFMKGMHRVTVWYCQYGDIAAKPTNIFSNNIRSLDNPDGWQPRPPCFNNNPNCHHERASRGSRTGTQGKSDHYTRSMIPEALCMDVIKASERSKAVMQPCP